jgi:uncharacterized membrane protein YeaQ/YmgE (transglycosylase-associated protein family)
VGIVTWALWGLFVGLFARLLMPGRRRVGIVLTVILGIAGSVVGGLVATEVLGIGDAGEFGFGSFVVAVLASTALLAAYDRVSRMLPDRDRERPER